MGKMLFGLIQYHEWPPGKIGSKSEWWCSILVLLYIHGLTTPPPVSFFLSPAYVIFSYINDFTVKLNYYKILIL